MSRVHSWVGDDGQNAKKTPLAGASCVECAAGNRAKFAAEMILDCPGLKNLDRSGVWIFPTVLVCMDCGFGRFTAPEAALTQPVPAAAQK